MSEELLKAILQLFAIVARERVTEAERTNIKEFLSVHLNRDSTNYYLKLFDEFVASHDIDARQDLSSLDTDTQQFVDDWAKIIDCQEGKSSPYDAAESCLDRKNH